MSHGILARHLRRLGLGPQQPPTDLLTWEQHLKKVEEIIADYRRGLYLLERSVEISSQEIMERSSMVERERARASYAAKMATLGEMASGIAHEVNNPLSIIAIKAQNCMRLTTQRSPENDELMLKFLKDIVDTAERIGHIVRGLRSFSRMGDDDPIESVSIATIFRDLATLSEGRIVRDQVELRIEKVPATLCVECRPVQISQVLLNLVSNAIYAVRGTPGAWVQISCMQRDEHIELRVIDSGKGIAPEIADKIFQPFFTSKPPGEGTGLGLSIAHGIAHSHGGDIYLDRNSSHTCFVLRLPLHQV